MPYDIEVPAKLFLTVNNGVIYYDYHGERHYRYTKEGFDFLSSWSEHDEVEVNRLPLFDEDMESSYESKEEYHRHLIIASIATGDLDFAMSDPYPFSVIFRSYKPDDLGNKLKVIVSFEAKGECCSQSGIEGTLNRLEGTGKHYLTLRNEFDMDMLKFHIKDDTDIKRFFDVLFRNKQQGDDKHE